MQNLNAPHASWYLLPTHSKDQAKDLTIGLLIMAHMHMMSTGETLYDLVQPD